MGTGPDEEEDRPLNDAERLMLAESYIEDRNRYIRKLETERDRIAVFEKSIGDIVNDISGTLQGEATTAITLNDVKWRLKALLAR